MAFFDTSKQFSDFVLDRRLQKAIGRAGFNHPTLVQSKLIPIALEGRDVLVRAKTGSGKTMAYAVPIIQTLLSEELTGPGIRCLILTPTRELSEQVKKQIDPLLLFCGDQISSLSLAATGSKSVLVRLFRSNNDFCVSSHF